MPPAGLRHPLSSGRRHVPRTGAHRSISLAPGSRVRAAVVAALACGAAVLVLVGVRREQRRWCSAAMTGEPVEFRGASCAGGGPQVAAPRRAAGHHGGRRTGGGDAQGQPTEALTRHWPVAPIGRVAAAGRHRQGGNVVRRGTPGGVNLPGRAERDRLPFARRVARDEFLSAPRRALGRRRRAPVPDRRDRVP